MRSRTQRGISLVELLVVVAVVVISFGLLLPALQSARAQARKATCLDNLKRMGLGLHNYHSVYRTLPMSVALGGKGHGIGHSCFAGLLPFMEHAPVYNSLNYSLENWHAANNTVTRTTLAMYLCPENSNTEPLPAAEVLTIDGKPYAGKSTFGRVHYGANWGGGREGWGIDFEKTNGQYRGVILPVAVMTKAGGSTTNVRLADIVDGLSFTIALAEKRDGFGWDVGGWGGSEYNIDPDPNYSGDDAKARKVYSGSYHDKVINVLMCDGSARPVRDSAAKRVWYALNTRDGAEITNPNDF